MTTRQLVEELDIVPSTVAMCENGKHPIPYDVAIKLADVLEIEASLLYDDFFRFLAVPYPFLFPIWNGTGMIRCSITNVEAAVCLYCRNFFII